MAKGLTTVYVFYATLLYGEYQYDYRHTYLRELPDGVLLFYPDDQLGKWYAKDLTPVLLEDVPKEIRTLALLMGLS